MYYIGFKWISKLKKKSIKRFVTNKNTVVSGYVWRISLRRKMVVKKVDILQKKKTKVVLSQLIKKRNESTEKFKNKKYLKIKWVTYL